MKTILIVIGSLLVVFLYIIYFIKTGRYKIWFKYQNATIIVLFISIFIAGLAFIFYTIGSNKGMSKDETISLIRNLKNENIVCIKFYSFSERLFPNVTEDTIEISKEKKPLFINKFVLQLSKIGTYEYGPQTHRWRTKVIIELNDNKLQDIRLIVAEKTDSRCILWIIKETNFGKFNLGSFGNNELGTVIENLSTCYDEEFKN